MLQQRVKGPETPQNQGGTEFGAMLAAVDVAIVYVPAQHADDEDRQMRKKLKL